ncbi:MULTISPECIES: hypothetical protein [Pontibacillus]|uniref:Uncharacterized protein n=1 Tax=Pontibacillus chungwhensis TaxID=265426 RepID=A0ABY8V315_9BACI|nr:MULTISPECIES: hypothetical protein [Pontibacillus]MCD5324497.1 hypothetical protein [Pontibacillus sp. HN14]WIF99209.1 hypothetical protein QNI29_05995 [Pontibacillus chungwhensis]
MKATDKYLPSRDQLISVFLFVVFLVFYWRVFIFLFYEILPSNTVMWFLSWVSVLVNFPLSALSVRYMKKWISEEARKT